MSILRNYVALDVALAHRGLERPDGPPVIEPSCRLLALSTQRAYGRRGAFGSRSSATTPREAHSVRAKPDSGYGR
jgi:hypothetical protein